MFWLHLFYLSANLLHIVNTVFLCLIRARYTRRQHCQINNVLLETLINMNHMVVLWCILGIHLSDVNILLLIMGLVVKVINLLLVLDHLTVEYLETKHPGTSKDGLVKILMSFWTKSGVISFCLAILTKYIFSYMNTHFYFVMDAMVTIVVTSISVCVYCQMVWGYKELSHKTIDDEQIL